MYILPQKVNKIEKGDKIDFIKSKIKHIYFINKLI